MGVGVVGGAPHTCTHTCTHAHARTCMCGKHDNFMQMATPIGFGEIPGIPYDVICMCVCASTYPPPPGGGPPISQNSIALELIEIFQFCLKI